MKSIIRFFSKKKEPYFCLLERILGFKPKNKDIYVHAFIHRSSLSNGQDGSVSNERLEFLGDAILGAAIADILYERFPDKDEGFLTKMRSQMVQRKSLDDVALKLGLDKLIVAQKNLKVNKGNHVSGNAFEALIGAIYIDRGFYACKNFINKLIAEKQLELLSDNDKSLAELQPKVALLQWSQKHKIKVEFVVDDPEPIKSEGRQLFRCTVFIDGKEAGKGKGGNKKEAQSESAAQAMLRVNAGEFDKIPSQKNVEPVAKKHKSDKSDKATNSKIK